MIFNIPSCKGNKNQNNSEILAQLRQNDCHQENKQQMLTRVGETEELLYMVGGM
jgi:hypothetical protein